MRVHLPRLGGLREGGAIDLGACACSPWARARPPTSAAPLAYITSRHSWRPNALAAAYPQRWRVEQAIEELLNSNDLDHLVSYRLPPNHAALGLRLLARNLAIGWQVRQAWARPSAVAPCHLPWQRLAVYYASAP
jgi:hypothetical protein